MLPLMSGVPAVQHQPRFNHDPVNHFFGIAAPFVENGENQADVRA
ncbi:MAG: hypothetical protein SF029_21820 [bacterium]|nr:hypothetical protein [bacterium]